MEAPQQNKSAMPLLKECKLACMYENVIMKLIILYIKHLNPKLPSRHWILTHDTLSWKLSLQRCLGL
jgi:hypothetical protein